MINRLKPWQGLLPILFAPVAYAADTRVPAITLPRIDETQHDIRIDGSLNEPFWQELKSYGDLRVMSPPSLDEVPFETDIRIFYTSEGLYFGIQADQPTETLLERFSFRDNFITRDGFSLTVDPSGEGLYAYWFSVNLGGSLGDGTVQPERQFARQWDGPWHGASARNDDGYSVEYFLPFSMITMPEIEGDTRTIGMYLSRRIGHKNEMWGWPALPDTQSQFLSALQPLVMENFKPRRQFTFYPYASTTYDVIAAEDDYRTGFDIFWRPSSNLQLTATLNPDFGNVETDDVVVNLTSFETFFPEKRPFFLEGQEIFATTPRASSKSRRGTPTILVHTRRIGGPPASPNLDDFDATGIELNQPTVLTGAAKITGQNGNWRYGVLTAVEDETKIEGTVDGRDIDFMQEGRTFGTARLLYETTSGGGRRGLGWITTLVDGPDYDAVVHGVDGHYLSKDGNWNIDGQLLYSDVDDIGGKGGFADITYIPKPGIQHKLEFDYYDDKLDINDFGFLRRNDAISARYRFELTETELANLKERETSFFLSQEYNTNGEVVRSGIFFNQERIFKNNNVLFMEANFFPARWDDLNSDGNGSYRLIDRWQTGFFYGTDSSKPVQMKFGHFIYDEDIGGTQKLYEFEFNWRPTDRFSVHTIMAYRKRTDWLIHNSGRDLTTYAASYWQPRIELDYFFSAKQQFRLALQWVGIKAREEERWRIPAGDGSLERDLRTQSGTRDFNISSLSFQLRYRWELAPLSDLFVVYTRGSDLPTNLQDSFTDMLANAWTDRAADVLVVKLRYRLGS